MKHVALLLSVWTGFAGCFLLQWRTPGVGPFIHRKTDARHFHRFILQDSEQSRDGSVSRQENSKKKSNVPLNRQRRQTGRGERRNNTKSIQLKQQPRRRVYPTKRRKPSELDSLLAEFQKYQEIDEWMKGLVDKLQNGTLKNCPFPKTWSSRDETSFIRTLRDRKAYEALELYVDQFARNNVFVCTAAISALANSQDQSIQDRVWLVLDKMDRVGIIPTSVTFAALFQAAIGPDEAQQIMMRLKQYEGKTEWSVEAFNQAILACARRTPHSHSTNKSWQIALEFSHAIRRQGLSPNIKTYSSLLHVCAQTGQVKIALSLVREIENNPNLKVNKRVWGSLLNVCAQAGDYKTSNSVLKSMPFSYINLAHCSAFLKALSRNGEVALSFLALDMMMGSNTAPTSSGSFLMNLPGVAPDLVALNTILACCAKAGDNEAYDAARNLVNRMRAGEFTAAKTGNAIFPDEISYSLLLSSCSVPDAAKDILKEMRLSRRYRVGVVQPNHITYARAIAVCGKAKIPDVDTAKFFLNSARNDGITPTVFMYSAAIWTAEKSNNFLAAKEIFEEMKAEGVEANSISYTGIISAAAKCGKMEDALSLYQEMRKKGCLPGATAYSSLALAVRQSQSSTKAEILEDIINCMGTNDRRVAIGGSVIEALIKEYGTKGSYKDAKRVFDMINGPSNGACLRAILLACATATPAPRWEEAVAILHCSDITSTAAGPGEVDLGALGNAIIACAKADRWEEGLNLLHLYGVKTTRRFPGLSVVALNAIIAASGRNGRPDVAVGILNEMERKYGLKPDERTYRSAIIACNQAEHLKRRHPVRDIDGNANDNEQIDYPLLEWWECALALLRRMREDGLKPDIQTFSSCISACEAAGQWQRALGILQSMIDYSRDDGKEEQFLNLFCFNAAISSCEKGGAWVEALEIYERMIGYGGLLTPNFVTLSSLVLALANAGQKELSDSKYNEGLKMKIVSPWRITKDSTGRRLKALDLHNFNHAMASSAVRSILDSLLRRGKNAMIEDDLVIIVGKGLRSAEEPVLLPTVQRVLQKDYGIAAADVDPSNRGRIVVSASTLCSLVSGRSWR